MRQPYASILGVEKLLTRLGYFEVKLVNTPHVAQSEIIGSLLHLMNFSRPDIARVVGRLSNTQPQIPNHKYCGVLIRLMKYLRDAMNYVITYNGFPIVLEGCSNANRISNSDETKFTSILFVSSFAPNNLCGEALLTTSHLQNRIPYKKTGITPFELWKKYKTNLKYLRVCLGGAFGRGREEMTFFQFRIEEAIKCL